MNLVELLLALLVLTLLSSAQQQFTRSNRLAWTAAMHVQDELGFLDSLEIHACKSRALADGFSQTLVSRSKTRGRKSVLAAHNSNSRRHQNNSIESEYTLTCHSNTSPEVTLRPVHCKVSPPISGMTELAFLCWEK